VTARDHQTIAEEAILDHFRNPEHEHFHSDDLWHLIPNEHRGVISLAVMALVTSKESGRATNPPVPSASEKTGGASGETSHKPEAPIRLPRFEDVPSAFDPYERAA
jgi:hypothetical protein